MLADEHGGLWLTGELASGPGTRITRYGAAVEGAYDMTVLGGALPPGAVACEVCDDARIWRTAACGRARGAQHAGEPNLRSPAALFASLANLQRASRRAALSADERADVLTVEGRPRPLWCCRPARRGWPSATTVTWH